MQSVILASVFRICYSCSWAPGRSQRENSDSWRHGGNRYRTVTRISEACGTIAVCWPCFSAPCCASRASIAGPCNVSVSTVPFLAVPKSSVNSRSRSGSLCGLLKKGEMPIEHSSFRRVNYFEKKGRRQAPSFEKTTRPELERDFCVELDLPASDGGACDVIHLTRPDGIAIGLAEARTVDHVPGVPTDEQFYIPLRPEIERLAE